MREENGEIKARLYDKRDDSEKEKSSEKSKEERSHRKSQRDKDQSSKGTRQETKDQKKNRECEVSNIASSYLRSKKTEPVREKKSTRFESERPKTELKITEKFVAKDLDKRMIAEL